METSDIIKVYSPIKTVCHVGSSIGQEVEDYVNGNVESVIWIEANHRLLNPLIRHTSKYNINNIYLPFALYDTDDEVLEFNIANNSECSSFMEFGELHISTYTDIKFVDKEKVLTKRFDNYINKQKFFDWDQSFNWNDVNMLVVDCQGADLKILKGFGDLLYSNNLKIIKCEVNFGEMYVGNPTEQELIDFLSIYGFIKYYWFIVDGGYWGDTYWIKKDILKN